MKNFLCLLCFCSLISADCRIDPRCGRYAVEPYPVVYDAGSWWSQEKRLDAGGMKVHPVPYETHQGYAMAPSPDNMGLLLHLMDVFPISTRTYTQTARLQDDTGRSYRLMLEWSGHFVNESRNLPLFRKREYRHFVRVTIDGRVVFLIDDAVDGHLYDYEDFFRLGNRNFRILVSMHNRTDTYSFEAQLWGYDEGNLNAEEGIMEAPRAVSKKPVSKKKPAKKAAAKPKAKK